MLQELDHDQSDDRLEKLEKLIVKAMKTITDKKGGSMPTGLDTVSFRSVHGRLFWCLGSANGLFSQWCELRFQRNWASQIPCCNERDGAQDSGEKKTV